MIDLQPRDIDWLKYCAYPAPFAQLTGWIPSIQVLVSNGLIEARKDQQPLYLLHLSRSGIINQPYYLITDKGRAYLTALKKLGALP